MTEAALTASMHIFVLYSLFSMHSNESEDFWHPCAINYCTEIDTYLPRVAG